MYYNLFMKESYRVCLVLPENNPHPLCFREVGLLLVSALQSNGYQCDFTVNTFHPDRINIILGYHLLAFDSRLENLRYIPYQMEQLHSEQYPFNAGMAEVLGRAVDVWDYSLENISFLKGRGIAAKLLIPGYHENLEIISPAPNRSIDILFYGSIGDRRKVILEELAALYKVKVLFGVYGEKRDKWISRSRLVLNFHHYSKQIFEAVRVSYLLNNRCFVVSETAADTPYPAVNLPLTPYEKLVETCSAYLKDPALMETTARENYEAFKANYPMTEIIRKVL